MSNSDMDIGRSATTSELRLRNNFRGSASPSSCLEMVGAGNRNSQFRTRKPLDIYHSTQSYLRGVPKSSASRSQPIRSYRRALCNTKAHSTFGVTFDAPRSVWSVFCRSCEYRMTRAGSSVRNSFACISGDCGVSSNV
jgi:hypothetical protein